LQYSGFGAMQFWGMAKEVREFHSLLVKIVVMGERGRGVIRIED